TRSDRDFLAAIECIAGAVPFSSAGRRSIDGRDRMELSAADVPLRLLYFGVGELGKRVSALVKGWGWHCERATTIPAALKAIGQRFDVLVLDAASIDRRMRASHALHLLRRAAPHIAL
ncbi:MAG: hypothetical protein ABR508_04450, partial [Candidatus Baltobacteraceae bacterium]